MSCLAIHLYASYSLVFSAFIYLVLPRSPSSAFSSYFVISLALSICLHHPKLLSVLFTLPSFLPVLSHSLLGFVLLLVVVNPAAPSLFSLLLFPCLSRPTFLPGFSPASFSLPAALHLSPYPWKLLQLKFILSTFFHQSLSSSFLFCYIHLCIYI